MERPSHIALTSPSLPRRLPLIALAVFLQASLVWVLTNGLAERIANVVRGDIQVTTVPHKPDTDLLPPPPPIGDKIKLITPEMPTGWTVDPGTKIIAQPNPPGGGGDGVGLAPDNPPLAIRATHTTPPYPASALRQQLEGQVTLRLTVTPVGRVSRAEIVTSSGSDTLDQAAQAWIVAHWTYRPAVGSGQPVAAQTLASVTFNLKNAR